MNNFRFADLFASEKNSDDKRPMKTFEFYGFFFFFTQIDWLVANCDFFYSVNSHSKAGGTNKQKRVTLSLASVSIF